MDSVMLREKIVSPIQTNAYSLHGFMSILVIILNFKKNWLNIACYCLLKMYNFNSYALSRFFEVNICFIIWAKKISNKICVKTI